MNPAISGVLWRLRCVGMIDEIMGHWCLTPSPAPLPSLEVGHGVGLKAPTL